MIYNVFKDDTDTDTDKILDDILIQHLKNVYCNFHIRPWPG